MYDVIMLVIEAGGYSLPDVLGKIEREWVLGNLAEEDRDSLIDAARANATPEGSMAPLQERMAASACASRRFRSFGRRTLGARRPRKDGRRHFSSRRIAEALPQSSFLSGGA